jgi:hypothetical protein
MQLIFVFLLQAASPQADGPILVMGNVQTEPAKERKICRAGAATGTRVTKNICRTQAEWDAMQSHYFNKTDQVFNNGRSGAN